MTLPRKQFVFKVNVLGNVYIDSDTQASENVQTCHVASLLQNSVHHQPCIGVRFELVKLLLSLLLDIAVAFLKSSDGRVKLVDGDRHC